MPKVLRFGKGLLIFALLALLLACEREQPTDTTIGAQGNTPATNATIFANAKVRKELNLGDQTDFEDARRGLIAVPTALEVAGPRGFHCLGYALLRFYTRRGPRYR